MRKIEITTDYIKLDQLLKFAGIVQTGGEGKNLINQNIVLVNGEIIRERGKKIKRGDIIEVKNKDGLIVI